LAGQFTDFVKVNRSVVPPLDTDVDMTRTRSGVLVDMPVNVELCAYHLVLTERDMRTDKVVLFELSSCPEFDTFKPAIGRLVDTVVVTKNKSQLTVQTAHKPGKITLLPDPYRYVSEVVDLVLRADMIVPPQNHEFIHFFYVLKARTD
jgi:hypothetical protein